jgi:molybdate transport system substrate-binding protein
MRTRINRWIVLCLLLLAAPLRAADSGSQGIIVFAASSLTDVLQELSTEFSETSSTPVTFSFAASSALARQLEAGARADVFFSADTEWMDYLQTRNLIQRASRQNIVSNRLVLIAPVDSKIHLKIAPDFALGAALNGGRLATGDPGSVPVGRYARSALTKLGVWNEVADRLVLADNVRAALAFVDRGEVPLGIVYQSDALIDKKVRVVDTFPVDSHLPIVYPIALTTVAKSQAAQFVAYVNSPAAKAAFAKYGFTALQ